LSLSGRGVLKLLLSHAVSVTWRLELTWKGNRHGKKESEGKISACLSTSERRNCSIGTFSSLYILFLPSSFSVLSVVRIVPFSDLFTVLMLLVRMVKRSSLERWFLRVLLYFSSFVDIDSLLPVYFLFSSPTLFNSINRT
jgi:hypothetical protein